MQILCVDIGTGTQDILLFNDRLHIENGFKLVVPSPTMIVRRRIQRATRRKEAVLLSGVTMGGGPSHWAAEDHLKAGLPLYATPDAARSFNDDLNVIEEMGIRVIEEHEINNHLDHVQHIEMRDFDFQAIATALENFGVSLGNLAAVVVGVFDHGAAPPNYSDRKFRFEYLASRIRKENRLSAFAYKAENIPAIMTRMQAVVDSTLELDFPLIVMDTAPAAVLGATLDTYVRQHERVLVTNIGNFHTLAFRLGPKGIEGVFEHHTGFMDQPKMESLIGDFAAGTLTNEYVFNDQGHGAFIAELESLSLDPSKSNLVVTGPRRDILRGSWMSPHFAVPFGDMMLTGCFGMLAACADLLPEYKEDIMEALYGNGKGVPPWEIL